MEREYILEKYGDTMKEMVLDMNGFEKVELYIINNNGKYRAVVNSKDKAMEVLEEEKKNIDTEWYHIGATKFDLKGIVLAENDISLIVQNGSVRRAYINNVEMAQKDYENNIAAATDSGIYVHYELINIKDEKY